MIELPWQVVVGAIGAVAAVVIALVMQLGQQADRCTQHKNELIRSTRQAQKEGFEMGYRTYTQLVEELINTLFSKISDKKEKEETND